jgi:hypothetical protein
LFLLGATSYKLLIVVEIRGRWLVYTISPASSNAVDLMPAALDTRVLPYTG